jgi:voltage-gated potassium channel Kch
VLMQLEVSGDPFFDFENRQNITMSDSLYFTLVTLTTVGYGDFTCKTVLGRLFNAFFLVCGIVSDTLTMPI